MGSVWSLKDSDFHSAALPQTGTGMNLEPPKDSSARKSGVGTDGIVYQN